MPNVNYPTPMPGPVAPPQPQPPQMPAMAPAPMGALMPQLPMAPQMSRNQMGLSQLYNVLGASAGQYAAPQGSNPYQNRYNMQMNNYNAELQNQQLQMQRMQQLQQLNPFYEYEEGVRRGMWADYDEYRTKRSIGSGTGVQMQKFNDLMAIIEDPNASEDRKNAARIALGLMGREINATPQVVDVGGVPYFFDKETNSLQRLKVPGQAAAPGQEPTPAQEVTAETVEETESQIEAGVAGAVKTAQLSADMSAEQYQQALTGIETAQETLRMINILRTHRGLPAAVGQWDSMTPTIFSETKDFEAKFDQLKGQLFLQAFERLKGAGQITELEGKKAEQAQSSLRTDVDEKVFKRGLNDMEELLKEALYKAELARDFYLIDLEYAK